MPQERLPARVPEVREAAQEVTFTVPGEPVPQPRHRAGVQKKGRRAGKAQLYLPDDHPVHTFKAAVALVAGQACRGRKVPAGGPVELTLVFVFPRPGYLVWKKKAMPREVMTAKPDLDNLAKAVKDAMNGIAWADDAQVVRTVQEKWYAAGGEPARTVVTVRAL